ncbi:reverse transcriptase domain, partial [Fusarium albosuccineum]
MRTKTLAATYTVEQGNPLLQQIEEYNEQLPDNEKTNKLQVPDELQHTLVQELHEHRLHGHPGIDKTLERVKATYTFPCIKKIVTQVTKECELCAKTKARRHKPYGMLQPLPVAEHPWDSITMDFITKLPLSEEPATGNFYDSILVIVDRLTKFSYFIPYRESTNAEEFAYLFYYNVAKVHGIPLEIISDRGPPFMSKFWQGLTGYLGINHKLSTA